MGNDGLFIAYRKQVAELAAKYRLPAIYGSMELVEAGGLMAYGANYPDLYRRAAVYVDKIFKGANPGDLPVEQPVKFELIINLRTAKALGITIPPPLLLRADGDALLIQLALAQVGKPYVWGAKGPEQFDCSGLVAWLYAQIGIRIPVGTAGQWPQMQPVTTADLQPGDLVFMDTEMPVA